MEKVIRYGGVEAIELYNCSAHTPEEWSSMFGEAHPIEGYLSLTFGFIVELLYIPIILVLFSAEYLSHSCFKVMSVLAVVDMMAIVVNSIITGYLLIEGAVFCSYPTLIYVSGAFGLGLWCVSCLMTLLLVVGRIVELFSSNLNTVLFEGIRTWVWVLMPVIYGFCFFFFTPPVLFNSKYRAWFFEPFIYQGRSMEYQNIYHSINNLGLVIVTGGIYAIFGFALGRKLKNNAIAPSSGSKKAQLQIFIQSSIVCLGTFFAAIIYVLMNFVELPVFTIKLAHMLWQFDHTTPVLIYLGMNSTIRNAAFNKLKFKKIRNPFHTDVSSAPLGTASKVSKNSDKK